MARLLVSALCLLVCVGSIMTQNPTTTATTTTTTTTTTTPTTTTTTPTTTTTTPTTTTTTPTTTTTTPTTTTTTPTTTTTTPTTTTTTPTTTTTTTTTTPTTTTAPTTTPAPSTTAASTTAATTTAAATSTTCAPGIATKYCNLLQIFSTSCTGNGTTLSFAALTNLLASFNANNGTFGISWTNIAALLAGNSGVGIGALFKSYGAALVTLSGAALTGGATLSFTNLATILGR